MEAVVQVRKFNLVFTASTTPSAGRPPQRPRKLFLSGADRIRRDGRRINVSSFAIAKLQASRKLYVN